MVFDLTHRPSFAGVGHWIDEIREVRGSDSLIILAGNKSDIDDERNVSNSEALTDRRKKTL